MVEPIPRIIIDGPYEHESLRGNYCRTGDVAALEAENDKLRGERGDNEQLAWEALGKPGGTHATTNVQRVCAQVERLTKVARASAEFFGAWWDQFCSGYSFDGNMPQEAAEKAGLAQRVPFDPDVHCVNGFEFDLEPGDEFIELTDLGKALFDAKAAEQREVNGG